MQASNFCGQLCICKIKQTDTNESKLKLFTQPISNSIFERLSQTRMPSTGSPTKYIAKYKEQKHQNNFIIKVNQYLWKRHHGRWLYKTSNISKTNTSKMSLFQK